MAVLPTITKVWTQMLTAGVPGSRIVFTTVLNTMQEVAFRLKDFLCASSSASVKYTLLWSASGGTGPTNAADHTDRIVNAAAWTPQATTSAASQAWYIVTGGQGEQIMVAFQGASNDVCRISYSPGGLFALAGTTNNQPTASDELVLLSATSVVNAPSSSADRILHVWARDDAKGFRCMIAQNNAMAGPLFFVEEFQYGLSGVSNVSILPVTGGVYASGLLGASSLGGSFTANQGGMLVKTRVSSINFSCQSGFTLETGGGATSLPAVFSAAQELHGGVFVPYPLGIAGFTTGSKGRMGNMIDMWCVNPQGLLFGDGFGNSYQFVQMFSLLWPNPSNQQPTIA